MIEETQVVVHEGHQLVRELIEWTARLRRRIHGPLRSRLFLYNASSGITCLAPPNIIYMRRRFTRRRQLFDF